MIRATLVPNKCGIVQSVRSHEAISGVWCPLPDIGSIPIVCGIYAAIVQHSASTAGIIEWISQYPDSGVYAWQARPEKVFGFDYG